MKQKFHQYNNNSKNAILHHDLKLDNILINFEDEKEKKKKRKKK